MARVSPYHIITLTMSSGWMKLYHRPAHLVLSSKRREVNVDVITWLGDNFFFTFYAIIWLQGNIDIIIWLDDNTVLNIWCYHMAG
jgi:hypothetical protein